MVQIRYALESDVEAIVAIENYYILNSHATFDVKPKTIEEKTQWFFKYNSTGPYRILLAVENGKYLSSVWLQKQLMS